MALVRVVAHVEPALAKAVQAAAKAQRTSVSDYAGTTLAMRVGRERDVAWLTELARAAISDASDQAASQGVERVLEAAKEEREGIRTLLEKFVVGLEGVLKAPAAPPAERQASIRPAGLPRGGNS